MKRPFGAASARARPWRPISMGKTAASLPRLLHPLVVAENRPRTMMPSEAGRAKQLTGWPVQRTIGGYSSSPKVYWPLALACASSACTSARDFAVLVAGRRRRAGIAVRQRCIGRDLGLLQLIAHLLRAQAGCLGQGGRIVQLAERTGRWPWLVAVRWRPGRCSWLATDRRLAPAPARASEISRVVVRVFMVDLRVLDLGCESGGSPSWFVMCSR